jgi:cell division septum initiation protein DivIVA
VSDGRLRGRVKKGLFGASSEDIIDVQPEMAYNGPPEPEAERQALQVLILARRTADEHVATAQQDADKIRNDARTMAEEIGKAARAGADGVRREADRVLAEARAKAEEMAKIAHNNAESVRREAEKALADARARADEIGKAAQASAEALDREAEQRYQNVVGSLEPKRAALQQQIDTLKQFERDYRSKLRKFMESQLRVLGNEDPPPPAPSQMVNIPRQHDTGEIAMGEVVS